jgi:asparagine synthase (glutamine-hydrolysing)
MCGIAGKLWYGAPERHEPARALLERMADRMAHRGPDAQGVWVDEEGQVGFAHRRLAIIDLDPRSTQPMPNEDGTVQLTFNGEIYNYQALRAELVRTGRHILRTTSDTEALIHLYEEHGLTDLEGYLRQLRGMFAFGLWDKRTSTLVLARDPIGEKPLYYAETQSGLVFGSTLGTLLESGSVERRADPAAIEAFLALGYIPAPFTAYTNVRKLPAGHYLVADAGGIRRIAPFWQLDFTRKLDMPAAEIERQIIERLDQATHMRMMSDVPLGAFLSGGVDSSAVVAMMARHSTRPVKTFSVGFAGSPLDESEHARLVAQTFGCDHTQLTAEVRPDELPQIVRFYEEPFADAAAIPTYFMSQAARQYVTVVLNGDGGDENFAGYTLRHRSFAMAERLAMPSPFGHALVAVAGALPALASESSLPYRARKSLSVFGEQGWRRNLALSAIFPPPDLSRWLVGDGSGAAYGPLRNAWQTAHRFNGLDRELYFSFALHLPEQLLVKVDRASMAWALEARPPLLDPDFVQFCASIPVEYKLTRETTKAIFKRALRGIVPDTVLDRPKQGFVPPLDAWLRHELRPLLEASLLSADSFVGGLLQPTIVRRLVEEHTSGRRDHQRKLYALLNLELWERQFIRGQSF